MKEIRIKKTKDGYKVFRRNADDTEMTLKNWGTTLKECKTIKEAMRISRKYEGVVTIEDFL